MKARNERNVVITGASTGIGRATSLRLDAYGWRVFAGVRKEEDAAQLAREASGSLVPLFIDITDADSVKAAAVEVEAATGQRLDGLVNNAGITVQAPLEYLPPEELTRQLEVNVTGQHRCTQAFLPSLRVAEGRVVFISSVQGRARALPLLGPYCASKWAVEALADTYRIELRDAGVGVAIVEPGTIETPIWDKAEDAFEQIAAELPPEGRERYAKLMKRGAQLTKIARATGVSPDRVAKKIQHALESTRPKTRYVVGDARPRILLEKPLPSRLRDWFIGDVLTR